MVKCNIDLIKSKTGTITDSLFSEDYLKDEEGEKMMELNPMDSMFDERLCPDFDNIKDWWSLRNK